MVRPEESKLVARFVPFAGLIGVIHLQPKETEISIAEMHFIIGALILCYLIFMKY